MSYRAPPFRCFICAASPALGRCARCERPLCLAHLHGPQERCERCELDWTAPLRGMRVVGPRVLVVLIIALMTDLFITGSAASVNTWSPEIEQIKWTGGAVALALIGVIGATQLWPALRFEATRRRFLAERRVATAEARARIAVDETAEGLADEVAAASAEAEAVTETAFGTWRARAPAHRSGDPPHA